MWSVFAILALPAQAAGGYLVIKETDRAGDSTYRVVTPQGLKELQDEIRAEMRHHGRALSLARKQWREHESKRRTFPASAIGRRSFRVVGSTYADEQKASDRAARLDENEENSRKIEQDREKDLEQRRYRKRASRKSRTFGDETRARDKKRLHERARQLYEQQLTLLMNRTGESSAGNE